MRNLVIMPAMAQNQSRFNLGEYAEEAAIIQDEPTVQPSVNFLEANTDAITMDELTNKCVVPTWANQELTIAHQDFISCVHDAACSFYAGERANERILEFHTLYVAEHPKVWARKHRNYWSVRRHNSTNVLHLPLPFQPLSKR